MLHSINKTFADAVAVYQLICTYAMFGKVCPERVVIYHNITYLMVTSKNPYEKEEKSDIIRK